MRRIRCTVEFEAPDEKPAQEAAQDIIARGFGRGRILEVLDLAGRMAEESSSNSNDLASFLLLRFPRFHQEAEDNAEACALLADNLGAVISYAVLRSPEDASVELVDEVLRRVRDAVMDTTSKIVSVKAPGMRH